MKQREKKVDQLLRLVDPSLAKSDEERISCVVLMARLMSQLSQADAAGMLSMSQSAESKVEAGQLSLSASQWMHFCRRFAISPWCILDALEMAAVSARFREWLLAHESSRTSVLGQAKERLLAAADPAVAAVREPGPRRRR